MDAARYVSPELSNFAKFQIPLQRQSPRSLNGNGGSGDCEEFHLCS